MNTVTHIALEHLTESPANVRRTGRTEGINELAASIAAHGLRQNLNVHQLDAEPGTYEVVAGQRRLLALRKLAEAGIIPSGFMVPCLILSGEDDATEISLAENQLRVAMHPDDQFQAFSDLVNGGLPVEDVAARFGVTPAVVRQRLKLAAVSPKLRAIYREGGMSLEQVMAFTLTGDRKKQEKVWKAVEDDQWERQPRGIRRALMEKATTADSKLARFVGIEAYEAAGGEVVRDLFDTEHTGYLTDPALVERLATEKLEAIAVEVRAEGWGWVETLLEREWQHFDQLQPVVPAEMGERDDEDGDTEEYVVTPACYDPEQMKGAGVRVVLGWRGEVEIERGLVRRELAAKSADGGAGTSATAKAERPEYNARQVEELTAHRTMALRVALAANSRVCFAALAHALASKAFDIWFSYPALTIRGDFNPATDRIENKSECPAHEALEKVVAAWKARLPKDEKALWSWCIAQDEDTLLDLILACSAMTLDATRRKSNEPQEGAFRNADQIAEALRFDMAKVWEPSADGFVGGMSKGQMIRALTEAGKPDLAAAVAKLKKNEAVRETAEGLAGTGWVPGFLKPALAGATESACAGAENDNLPAADERQAG